MTTGLAVGALAAGRFLRREAGDPLDPSRFRS
jgi:hypothetical protein